MVLFFLHSAGLINHDIIININGQPVHTMQEVSEAIQSSTELSMVVRRKDEDVSVIIYPEEGD